MILKPYTTRRNIHVKIEMTPEQTDAHWRTRLFLHVCQKIKGACTHDDGYIINVRKILRIHDHYISRLNGMVVFSLDAIAECILPKTGDMIDVVVDMIFPHGVFCHHQMLRMMMPATRCGGLIIRQEFSTNSLYNPSTHQSIRKGDVLSVFIEDVRFENDLYSCIVSYKS